MISQLHGHFIFLKIYGSKDQRNPYSIIDAGEGFWSKARTYLQLPLRQWGVGNVYLLVLSS